MQVKVPKFIDIEDRVVFGLTWKQVLSLGAGIGAAFFFLTFFASVIAFPLALIAVASGAAFAFAKVNERPFKAYVQALWRYYMNPQRYFWKKERPRAVIETKPPPQAPKRRVVTREELQSITSMLDTTHQGHT